MDLSDFLVLLYIIEENRILFNILVTLRLTTQINDKDAKHTLCCEKKKINVWENIEHACICGRSLLWFKMKTMIWHQGRFLICFANKKLSLCNSHKKVFLKYSLFHTITLILLKHFLSTHPWCTWDFSCIARKSIFFQTFFFSLGIIFLLIWKERNILCYVICNDKT
jgi:hypothetical protein